MDVKKQFVFRTQIVVDINFSTLFQIYVQQCVSDSKQVSRDFPADLVLFSVITENVRSQLTLRSDIISSKQAKHLWEITVTNEIVTD